MEKSKLYIPKGMLLLMLAFFLNRGSQAEERSCYINDGAKCWVGDDPKGIVMWIWRFRGKHGMDVGLG